MLEAGKEFRPSRARIITSETTADARHNVHHASNSMGLQHNQQNTDHAERPDRDAKENYDPRHRAPTRAPADRAGYGIHKVTNRAQGRVRNRQDVRNSRVQRFSGCLQGEERIPYPGNDSPLVQRDIARDQQSQNRKTNDRQTLPPSGWIVVPPRWDVRQIVRHQVVTGAGNSSCSLGTHFAGSRFSAATMLGKVSRNECLGSHPSVFRARLMSSA